MIFRETPLAGAYLIDIDKQSDDRGFFARLWCRETLAARGLVSDIDQCSISVNHHAGILRGLHYQAPPFWETKVVQCLRGAIFDVIVDLRIGSPTFGRHFVTELSAESRRMLYIPQGFAHGFQTLEAQTDVTYAITPGYIAEAAAGVRFDDSDLAIAWPLPPALVSARDRCLPSLAEATPSLRAAAANGGIFASKGIWNEHASQN